MTGDKLSPHELMQKAASHEERAEQLQQDAIESLQTSVEESLEFAADVDVTYVGTHGVFKVEITPTELSSKIADVANIDEKAHVSPMTLTYGERTDTSASDGAESQEKLKELISDIEDTHDEGAPIDAVLLRARELGFSRRYAEDEIEQLRRKGDVYEPKTDHLRTI